MIIQPLFPIPVGQFSIDREFTQSELEVLIDLPRTKNTGNSNSVDSYILRHRKLRPLKQFIERCLAEYVESVYSPSERMELIITQSWVNYTEKAQYHHKHSHPNSLVSGVLYIQTDDATDKIMFYRDSNNQFKIFQKNFNVFNSDSWWLPAKQGSMLLFPSNLNHSVDMVESDKTRISLAFNTFPIGVLGRTGDACNLIIKSVE